MYIEIKKETECSKCKTRDYTETVLRDNSTFIRCRKCGHEKLISTTTVTTNTKSVIYNARDYDNKEIF